MPRLVSAILLMLLGAGILAMAWRGHVKGEIPAGSSGFQAYRPNRIDQPLVYRIFLTLYFVGGMALEVWGILALFGAAPAIKLR
jgi:hypothetical protein